MSETNSSVRLPFFERYLSLWVIFCIIAGVIIGKIFPGGVNFLSKLEVSQVNIPVAVLIWLMIYPMMVQIDFSSIVKVGKKPKGLAITLVVNWLIKPFSMAIFAVIFLKYLFSAFINPVLAKEYIAGAILLGAAPCTAMVFVWSYLTKGNPAHTLVQVAVNDLVILIAFVPIVKFLLGVNQITVPYDTLIYSTILFVVVPLAGGYISRQKLIKHKGATWLENVFLKILKPVTILGLLLTLVLLFAFQGKIIIENPLHIFLIAVPLTIQTYFIFAVGYFWARKWRVEHSIASPAALIGASNFFELSVAVAIALFGLKSGAALATVVGVLTEVPIMLSLVKFSNKTRHWFAAEEKIHPEVVMAKKRVLVLCTGNSCRSQMAEGFLHHMAGDRFEVFSAGVKPTQVNPLAIKVMAEVGVDISKHRSKSAIEFIGQKFDYVITVCDNAKQTCPVFPGKYEKIHWSLEDPAEATGTEEEKLMVFRKIRNQIKENILTFLNLPKDKANLKCPYCGYVQEVIIPRNLCLHYHKCKTCHKTIVPTPDSCCVICAYSDKNCPSFSLD